MAAPTEMQARFRAGGEPIPAFAKTTVRAGRFVKVVDTKTTQGDYQVGECGLGEEAIGVSELDSAASTESANDARRRIPVVRKPQIARVVPGANVTYNAEIISDAQGRAIPKAADVQAALDTGVVGSNNAITWTAKTGGTGGNSVQVEIIDPPGNNAALSIDVNAARTKITVNGATDGSSALTSTAQQVIDAVEAHGEASEIVTAAHKSTSTGAGVVAAVAATNLAGGVDSDGTGYVNGRAMHTALSTDAFVEVALT